MNSSPPSGLSQELCTLAQQGDEQALRDACRQADSKAAFSNSLIAKLLEAKYEQPVLHELAHAWSKLDIEQGRALRVAVHYSAWKEIPFLHSIGYQTSKMTPYCAQLTRSEMALAMGKGQWTHADLVDPLIFTHGDPKGENLYRMFHGAVKSTVGKSMEAPLDHLARIYRELAMPERPICDRALAHALLSGLSQRKKHDRKRAHLLMAGCGVTLLKGIHHLGMASIDGVQSELVRVKIDPATLLATRTLVAQAQRELLDQETGAPCVQARRPGRRI